MLRLQNLKKSYLEASGETLPILDIPEFHVAPGEQLAMIGQSGCGKSTLLHVISGISRPDSGRILVDGIDVATFGFQREDEHFHAPDEYLRLSDFRLGSAAFVRLLDAHRDAPS